MSIDRLILWRHGLTEWNSAGRFQGQQDVPLAPKGERQAAEAAPYLAAEKPAAIYASDLQRALATARALAELTDLDVHEDQRLRETSLGLWEGLDRAEVAERFPDELAAWQRGDEVHRGHGESASEVADRAIALVQEISESHDGTVVLVAHGGMHKALLARAIGLPEAHWMQLSPLANCRWSDLRRSNDGSWRLHGHNVGPLAALEEESTPNVDSDETLSTEEPPASPKPAGTDRGTLTDQTATAEPIVPEEVPAYSREQVAGDYRYQQLLGNLPAEDK